MKRTRFKNISELRNGIVAKFWFRNAPDEKGRTMYFNDYVDGAIAGLNEATKYAIKNWQNIAGFQVYNNQIQVGDKMVVECFCAGYQDLKLRKENTIPILYKDYLMDFLGVSFAQLLQVGKIPFTSSVQKNEALNALKNTIATTDYNNLIFKDPNQIYYHCKKLLAQDEPFGSVQHFARKAMEKNFNNLGEAGIEKLLAALKK